MVNKNEEIGFLYLAQLYPDRDKNLFKFGFSKSPGERACKHKCLAPKLKILQTWSGDLSLEKKVLKEAADLGFLYGGEVLSCSQKQIVDLVNKIVL